MEPLDAENDHVDLELPDIIEVSGFTHVEVRNFNVKMQASYIDRFGFSFLNSRQMNLVNLSNMTFSRFDQDISTSASDTNKLVLKFQNVFDKLIIEHVSLENYTFLNQTLFSTEYTVVDFQKKSVQVLIRDLNVSNTVFTSSEVFSLRLNISNFTALDWNIKNCQFLVDSQLLRDRTSAEQGLMHFVVHNLSLTDSIFTEQSYFVQSTMVLSFAASHFKLLRCQFNTTVLALISANELHLYDLLVRDCYFLNASLFQNTQKKQLEDSSSEVITGLG